MRVKMVPNPKDIGNEESGIRRVVEAYARYGKDHGIEWVGKEDEDYDVFAVHAGMAFPEKKVPIVAITHGLYFTADYLAYHWEYRTNANVIASIRAAKVVTVPSDWVSEIFKRDMHLRPVVVPHGIEWSEWQHKEKNEGYVLWNKNRAADVCDPTPVNTLASMFPSIKFVTTYAAEAPSININIVGLQPHSQMKKLVQRAGVYLSSTKETFGIGVLEALASGVPVLGFDHGGNRDLVKHGINGYLARVGDYDDLRTGLMFCIDNRDALSANARESSKEWTWDKAMEELLFAFETAMQPDPPLVGVVIPSYNYADKVGRAIESALNQTVPVDRIIVVDDGSTDNTPSTVADIIRKNSQRHIQYIRQDNSGVAVARNKGIEHCNTKYIICLDADDAIEPQFVEACLKDLENEPALGIAYTGIMAVKPNGESGISPWPGPFDYSAQLKRHNQVPTCCMFRRVIWERLGGYRQRYAPNGAGAEDAEFWLRAGSIGFNAKKVTDAGLFVYSWQSGRVSGNPEYKEVDWLSWHPWTQDNRHPFASVARPARFSHAVRQYDQPTVSVIIPIGPKHKQEVINALDSLEAQFYRKWEVILVEDALVPDFEWRINISNAFPFVRFAEIKHLGAGAARNAGAAMARSPFLLFLDADDWLYPEAIQRMLDRWDTSNAIIYSDYVSKSYLELEYARSLGEKLLFYDEKDGNAVINSKASDYDCSRAVAQPDPNDTYIWNLITSLVPKAWHDEIGGFDETMSSWEDWDYWIRMARAGKCFDRIDAPLVVYRFYTGTRREIGQKDYKNLIEYLLRKYKKDVPMPCHCNDGNSTNQAVLSELANRTQRANMALSSKGNGKTMNNDEDFVLCLYDHPNLGSHQVTGAATRTNYGYRGGGERFLVHQADISAQPNIFRPIVVEASVPVRAPTPPPPPAPPAPVKQAVVQYGDVTAVLETEDDVDIEESLEVETADVEEFSLDTVPGITPEIAGKLQARGVQSLQDLVNMGNTSLMQIKGIGPSRADAIITYARKVIAEQDEK